MDTSNAYVALYTNTLTHSHLYIKLTFPSYPCENSEVILHTLHNWKNPELNSLNIGNMIYPPPPPPPPNSKQICK